MNQTLQQLKSRLSTKKTGIMAILDPDSKEYQGVLNEFLPKIQQMLNDAKKDLRDISQNADLVKKEMQSMYKVIKCQEKEIKEYNDKIKEYEKIIKMANVDLNQNIQAKDQYDKDMKTMELNWCIPFAGFFIMINDKKSGKYDRYIAERNHIQYVINEIENKISTNKDQLSNISDLSIHLIQKYDINMKKLNQHRKKVSNSINQVLYLSILEERLNMLRINGNTASHVLELLDKEPDMIHFDDDIYMDIIKAYYEHPDSFKDYIIKGEKEFL
ncbi:hypothetical protein [Candidatus Stoquefichus massiliensis]|uniref:hypothetical protein n=1 Tax=Candidatus Stoquefichus massiliensis TaxID=1470350 RepID=UPI0004866EB2|nr:hypothetical protein [Candidatus Stoquefichus massiliensis]